MPARLSATFRVWPYPANDDEPPRVVSWRGQTARTLLHAHAAGEKGITAAEVSTWALRLAAYVHDLRREGLTILMDRECHDGPSGPGWHGRYRVLNRIEVVEVKTPSPAAGRN